jgi:hypothetical protein
VGAEIGRRCEFNALCALRFQDSLSVSVTFLVERTRGAYSRFYPVPSATMPPRRWGDVWARVMTRLRQLGRGGAETFGRSVRASGVHGPGEPRSL